jgi:hypothetical protein
VRSPDQFTFLLLIWETHWHGLQKEIKMEKFEYYHGKDAVDLDYAIRLLEHEAEEARKKHKHTLAEKLTDIAIHLQARKEPAKPLADWPEV